jgi:hypothetical protein
MQGQIVPESLSSQLLRYLGHDWYVRYDALCHAIHNAPSPDVAFTLSCLLQRLHDQEKESQRLLLTNKKLKHDISAANTLKLEPRFHKKKSNSLPTSESVSKQKQREMDRVIKSHTLLTSKIIDTSTLRKSQLSNSVEIGRNSFEASPLRRQVSADITVFRDNNKLNNKYPNNWNMQPKIPKDIKSTAKRVDLSAYRITGRNCT